LKGTTLTAEGASSGPFRCTGYNTYNSVLYSAYVEINLTISSCAEKVARVQLSVLIITAILI